MRQVLARQLRPGDTIETPHGGAARVVDLPVTCYEPGRISVTVPVSTLWRSQELTFAATDFVPVIDRLSRRLALVCSR
ncbi:hypothetical protein [Nocardioides panacisoli]|uniref:AbrB/MazE/SpoVT family DNA-binding domain-containing protein n=1 Tax=Nocardioides panacisoli TaxID=627624 RepID=A0ABP7I5K0_9ACTN